MTSQWPHFMLSDFTELARARNRCAGKETTVVCVPCQRKHHAGCPGRGFCDCQHREPIKYPEPTHEGVVE